jgi:hypothetical protein
MDIDSTAPVVTRDEILIHAPLTEVWKAQTDISAWPQWRPEVPAARLDGELAVGSVFHWEEGGLRITSTVTEIVQPMPGREESITVQGPREFTGDVDLIFGHPAVVEARAGEDGEVLALRREALLALVQTDPGLSELLLRTFLQRRAFLIAHGKGDGILVGSRHSADTLRIREFLSRNGRPYTYLDVDYLGFPEGISGQLLAARAFTQANKFGAKFAIARSGAAIRCEESPCSIELEGGGAVKARALVIASGVKYRSSHIPGVERFEGAGVYHAATHLEEQLCAGEEVAVVGGGNSAGQAVVFLARAVRQVHMLVRGPSLAETMSRYLIRCIEEPRRLRGGRRARGQRQAHRLGGRRGGGLHPTRPQSAARVTGATSGRRARVRFRSPPAKLRPLASAARPKGSPRAANRMQA